MLSRTELVTGTTVGRELASRLVQHEVVDALAIGVVAVRFQIGGRERPMGAIGFLLREGLGLGDSLAIDVGCRAGLFEIAAKAWTGIPAA